MSQRPHIKELLICRSLLSDPACQALADVLSGQEEKAGTCAALLIETAEEVGLSGNLLRSYLLYRLVHDANLAAQTTEVSRGPIGESLHQAFVQDIALLLPFLTQPASDFLGLELLDDYQPTTPLATEIR